MIQVLNHGTTYNEKVCPRCSCRFKYDEEDIKEQIKEHGYENFKMVNDVRVVTKKGSSINKDYFIICPECEKEIFIKRILDDGEVITELLHY